ncbi:hypothetical protein BCA97_24245, partial [Salmonella enterica subsp. enterica serovar Enteritidis]
MSKSRIMKWITGIFDACLAIHFIGGLFIISNGYSPLMVMLILHIITLVLSKRDQGMAVTVDHLGEFVTKAEIANERTSEFIQTIQRIADSGLNS